MMRTQPVNRSQSQTVWEEVCIATDYESGQLQGEVGTLENPQFTYEKVMHNRRNGKK